jgi:hypothetical protein
MGELNNFNFGDDNCKCYSSELWEVQYIVGGVKRGVVKII